MRSSTEHLKIQNFNSRNIILIDTKSNSLKIISKETQTKNTAEFKWILWKSKN